MNYSGRLVDAEGKPVAGPVDLQLKLFDHASNPSLIPVTIPVFDGVTLTSGVFQVTITLPAADYHTAFNGTDDVWVEAKDVTHNKTYPRQRFSAVPYALKVPVDGITVLYDTDGRLRAVTGGTGNMNTGTYDAGGVVGIVDQAELATDALDAQLLDGESAADLHDAAQLTGSIADARLSVTVTKLGSDISLTTEVSGVLPVANLPVGATAAHVAAGNDARFTDSRAPNGTAGGGLTGTYPNPTIATVPDGALSANVSKLGTDIDLSTAEATGVLPVSKGGTGVGTVTGLVKGNGTGAFTAATLADLPVSNRLQSTDGSPADSVFVDTTGYVGIRTTTPSRSLHLWGDGAGIMRIEGGVTGTPARRSILEMAGPDNRAQGVLTITGGTEGWFFGKPYSGTGFTVGNHATQAEYLANSKLYIDTTGKVGIGSSAPETALEVIDATAAATFTGDNNQGVRISGAGNGNYGLLQFSGTQDLPIAQIGALQDDLNGTTMVFGTSNNYGTGITNAAMAIDHSAKVGIGTMTPGKALDVVRTGADTATNYAVASVRTTGAAGYGPTLLLDANAMAGGKHWGITSGGSLDASGAGNFAIWDNSGYRAVIDAATGNMGIGVVGPTAKLHVGGVAGTDGIKFPDGTLQTTAIAALTANRNFYVRPDGNDSNTGLVNNAGGAFLTIQKAIDTTSELFLGKHNVIINVADGTYTTPVVVARPWSGQGNVTILGNVASPQNVIVHTTGATAIFVTEGGRLNVSGFEIRTTTSGHALYANLRGTINVGAAMRFGSCAGYHIVGLLGSVIYGSSDYTIAGSALIHLYADRGAQIQMLSATVTLTGTPAFSHFAYAIRTGVVSAYSNTYVGAATGSRYGATTNGLVNVDGAAVTYLPGSIAGSTATGGQYN